MGKPIPNTYVYDPIATPTALTSIPQWLVCDINKVPHHPKTGLKTNDNNGVSYQDAVKALKDNPDKYKALGLHIEPSNNIVIVDLDNAFLEDSLSVDLDPNVRAWIDRYEKDVYIEVSPSGTGLHAFIIGNKTTNRSRSGNIEIYNKHFITFTGDKLDASPSEITSNQQAIDDIIALLPEAKKISNATNLNHTCDVKVKELASDIYSHILKDFKSEYDTASGIEIKDASTSELFFLCFLAKFTKDADVLKSLYEITPMFTKIQAFRSGGINASKWFDRDDYVLETLTKAINSTQSLTTKASSSAFEEFGIADNDVVIPYVKCEKPLKEKILGSGFNYTFNACDIDSRYKNFTHREYIANCDIIKKDNNTIQVNRCILIKILDNMLLNNAPNKVYVKSGKKTTTEDVYEYVVDGSLCGLANDFIVSCKAKPVKDSKGIYILLPYWKISSEVKRRGGVYKSKK